MLTWEAVTAMAALAGLIGTGFALYVKLMIHNEIERGNAELLKLINGTYIRRGECSLIRGEVERRLQNLEEGTI